ncbi:tetratricopeptide repeat protein [Mucilaginibacter sp. FT3.2]|uniref:tetratricopeptide repeat protein n=1 Tax=Mucilaginibacter sp. FT3.2 TaxID=2723090 RepID=UPI0016093ECF|nr:tetratricopeptide repeat protein [Mucilaginibacter sp. FT3.2]MBB6234648.1 tetratricopeptide (TPR) repeat protein [Mucilaginibacter sp. FT3.2]
MNNYLKLLCFGALMMPAAASYAQNGIEYVKKAAELTQAGDYTGAITNYTKAIAINKNNKVILTILYDKRAACKTELKLYREAIADETIAIAASPQYPFAYWNRGFAYSRAGEFQQGINDYTKAIPFFKANNQNLSILYDNRGSNEVSLKQYDKAINDFTLAIAQHVPQGGAYWHRAFINNIKGNYQQAIDDYTSAIFYVTENPLQMALIYDGRGVSKRNLKQYRESINDFNTAIKLNPNSGNLYWHRGFTYQVNGDYQLAVDDYTAAMPFYQADKENLALLYENRSINETRSLQPQKAMDDISKAINLAPQSGDIYWTRGSIYSQIGEPGLAIDDFNKALQILKDNKMLAALHSEKATNLYVLNQNQQVIDECTTAIALNPYNISPYYTRGRAYLKMGADKQLALNDLNKVIGLDTAKSSVSYIFAQFYTGHPDLALQILQQQVLITPNPDDVLTHYYNIACVFSIMNKPDEANIYLKKAIDAGYSKKFAANDEDLNNIRKTPDYIAAMADSAVK